MMEAQIIGDLCHQGVEHGIPGEAEDVVGLVVLSPVHRLEAGVVAVAAPDDPGVGPMSLQTLGDVLDDGPHLGALRGARRAQDCHHRGAARHVIDVHRCEAALVMMGVPERKLLSAMRRAECVVDVEDLERTRPHGGAELVNKSCTQAWAATFCWAAHPPTWWAARRRLLSMIRPTTRRPLMVSRVPMRCSSTRAIIGTISAPVARSFLPARTLETGPC